MQYASLTYSGMDARGHVPGNLRQKIAQICLKTASAMGSGHSLSDFSQDFTLLGHFHGLPPEIFTPKIFNIYSSAIQT